ncbi:carbonic anhydrase 13-like [Hetaerina americana]|uniref:carbonic anhydrase 13-like n=2 Tax=Hetaerina americana TaxID=62018 RepID=UPI003A7F1C6F
MILLQRAVALAVTIATLGALAAVVDVPPAEEHPEIHHAQETGRHWDSSGSSSSEPDSTSTEELEFGYGKENGPRTWPKTFPTCGGERQSPININMDKVEELTGLGMELRFKNYDSQPMEMAISNNGHTLTLTGNWSRKETPRISGCALKGDYIFSQIHFHWGKKNEEGSEHLVNGYSYSAEMHAVHYKKKYGSLEEALKKRDGVAVLGYFLKVKEENTALQNLLDKVEEVTEANSPPAQIEPFMLEELAPPFRGKYVTYQGSLTIPPCLQVVTWLVRLKPINISLEQLKRFRLLEDEEGKLLIKNVRPTQRLNGRVVYYVA